MNMDEVEAFDAISNPRTRGVLTNVAERLTVIDPFSSVVFRKRKPDTSGPGERRKRPGFSCSGKDRLPSRVIFGSIGLAPTYLEQLHTFTAPRRDLRERVVSISRCGLIPDTGFVPAGDDKIDRLEWVAPSDESKPWAFDHAAIVGMAGERLRAKVHYAPVSSHFFPGGIHPNRIDPGLHRHPRTKALHCGRGHGMRAGPAPQHHRGFVQPKESVAVPVTGFPGWVGRYRQDIAGGPWGR